MSKYNLKDLLIEGMSDKEFADAKEADRLEAHPEKDTIAKIKAMMAKEKSMKEDKYDDMVDADDDISADKKKDAAAAYRKVDKGDSFEKATSHIKENYQMDGETYERIDGLTSQPLLKSFIDAFKKINSDYIESGDEFDIEDVVDYLTIQLDKESRNMNEGSDGKTLDESKTLEDLAKRLGISVEDLEARVNKFQSAERGAIDTRSKLSMAESSVDENEFDFFTAILDGRYKEEDIEDYLKSDDYQAAQDEFKLDDTYTSDWVQEFANYFDSRMDEGNALDADEDTDAMIAQMKKDGKDADDFVDEGLKEHFQRFLKDYQ